MDRESSSKNEFKIERLKFVLQQIDRLNERFHKYVTLFQSLTTAIIVAGAAIFALWSKEGVSDEAARAIIHGLLGLFTLFACFVVVFIGTGIFSWVDYRKEEVQILDDGIEKGYRQPPKLANVFRWHEFYLLLMIVISVISIFWFTKAVIIPLIQ